MQAVKKGQEMGVMGARLYQLARLDQTIHPIGASADSFKFYHSVAETISSAPIFETTVQFQEALL